MRVSENSDLCKAATSGRGRPLPLPTALWADANHRRIRSRIPGHAQVSKKQASDGITIHGKSATGVASYNGVHLVILFLRDS